MSYTPEWHSFLPTVQSKAAKVITDHPSAWTKCQRPGDDGEFIRLLAAECHAIEPKCGLNYKRGVQGDLSKDILAFPNPTGCRDVSGTHVGLELVDVIPGHEGPNASIGWTDVTVDDAGNFFAPGYWVKPATATPAHTTALGCSLFWALAGFQQFRLHLDREARWAADTLGADFVRFIGVLGGDLFGGIDPWLNLRTDWRSPTYVGLVRDTVRHLYETFGLKSQITLVGGRAQVETDLDQTMLVDRVANAINPVIAYVQYSEIWNEWAVNRAERHELRAMARRLKFLLPRDFSIALSSPDSIMGGNASATTVRAEIEAMYGGDSGANLITLHPTRPEPLWNAESVRAALVGVSLGFPLEFAVGEPRGPRASAGGDTSHPAIIAGDYSSAIRGRAKAYVYHPLPGIWGGRCNGFPAQNEFANFADVPNAAEIAAALKQIRKTGSTPTVPIPGGPNVYPYDEGWVKGTLRPEIVKRYEAAGAPLDADYAVWVARTQYDIATGALTPAASLKKHMRELEKALPRKSA